MSSQNLLPIFSNSFSKSKAVGDLSIMKLPVTTSQRIVVKERPKSQDNARSYLKVANAIATAKVPKGVKVTSTERGLSIRIADDTLFSSGSSAISPQIQEFLDLIAGLIRDLPNAIAVEGHTDNKPIRTAEFPSNWDLSTARANALIRYFIGQHHMQPERFSSTGFAGTRPIESNSTLEGQSANRRVELIVLRDTEPGSLESHPFLP